MCPKRRLFSGLLLFQVLTVSAVSAEQVETQNETNVEFKDGAVVSKHTQSKSRSGYETDDLDSAGRASVTRRLALDDRFVPEHLRFPEFDKSLQPYFEWKRGLEQKHGLQFAADYTSLLQKASDSLTAHDTTAGGVFRLYGQWMPFNQEAENTGALVFKIENSHNYGNRISPDDLADEIGYLGSTGLLYADQNLVLNDFNWQQYFNNGQAELIIGRFDVNDYMDVVDYANPWTTFQNSNILENQSIAIPDTSYGFNLSSWLNNHWYLKAAIIDANGKLDDVAIFEQGAEFFSYAEAGWAPDASKREIKGVHVTIWHVDERVNEAVPDGEGIAIGGSWSFDEAWIIFARAGQSQGAASLMKRTATIGFGYIGPAYFDVFGWAVNYSQPVDPLLSDQTTMEAFLKIQLTQNIAVTPSFQWLINPALNPQQEQIQVYGLRLRLVL